MDAEPSESPSESHEASDELYAATRQAFVSPAVPQRGSFWPVLLFALFVISQLKIAKSVGGVIVLVAIVFFHELGHLVGMRLFGFQDLKMFFIPFFGAAASGRPAGAAAWKSALVSLLGPLPGVLLGVVLMIVLEIVPHRLLLTAVELLLLLNLFNLLPFGGLDGGRFFQRVLFSRHRILDVIFQLFGALALLGLAIALSSIVLGFFAALGLVTLGHRHRLLKAGTALRKKYPELSTDPTLLTEEQIDSLYEEAQRSLQSLKQTTPAVLASTMHTLLDTAERAPGFFASVGLLVLYVFTWMIGGIAGILLLTSSAKPDWKVMEKNGIRIEWPSEVQDRTRIHAIRATPDLVSVEQSRLEDLQRFTLHIKESKQPIALQDLVNRSRQRMLTGSSARLVHERDIEQGGLKGRELELRNSYRIWRLRLFVIGNRGYEVATSSPEFLENQRRFLDSFQPLPTTK